MAQYSIYSDGEFIYRKGVRAPFFVIDKEISGIGFSGLEDFDWVNIKAVKSPFYAQEVGYISIGVSNISNGVLHYKHTFYIPSAVSSFTFIDDGVFMKGELIFGDWVFTVITSVINVDVLNQGQAFYGNVGQVIAPIEGKLEIRNYSWTNDRFTQEVYDYYHNNVVPDYTHGNYNTVYYVDPTYSGGGNNGSISNPYTSVMSVPISSNTAIRIKRGTTHDITGSSGNWDTPSGAAHIFIGAYGEGPRPIMTGDNIRFRGWYPVVRDIEGKFAYTHSNRAHNAIMFNIKSGNVWTFSHNLKAIGCEFSYTGRNGMFVQQWDLDVDQHTEIAYCYIHHVNQRWHSDNKSQSYADGDGIQFSQYRGSYHIHNCIVDRHDTGNKFCIIVNAHTNEGHMLSGIIEDNILIGPHPYPDGGAVIYLGNVVPEPTASAYHHCTMKKNIVIGSPYDGSYTGAALYTNSTLTRFYGNILADLRYGVRMGSHFGQSEYWNNTFVQQRGSIGNAVQGDCYNMHNNIFPHSSHGSATVKSNNIDLATHNDTDVFLNPAAEDFRLKAGSPAIDAGTWLSYMNNKYNTDLRSVTVPQNSNIDIGALQYE